MAATLSYFDSNMLVLFLGGELGLLLDDTFVLLENIVLDIFVWWRCAGADTLGLRKQNNQAFPSFSF